MMQNTKLTYIEHRGIVPEVGIQIRLGRLNPVETMIHAMLTVQSFHVSHEIEQVMYTVHQKFIVRISTFVIPRTRC